MEDSQKEGGAKDSNSHLANLACATSPIKQARIWGKSGLAGYLTANMLISMRLLIIEDSADFRDMLTELLQRQGYETLAFDDPTPALAEVDLSTIDLIITDLVMETSGKRAIEFIRSQGITIPIVVLTGYLEDKEVEHLIEIGATRVLEKPIKVSQLVSNIQLLLGEERGSDAAETPSY